MPGETEMAVRYYMVLGASLLLAACGGGGGSEPEPPPVDACPAWSAAASWGGQVPAAGDAVVIPAGQCIRLDTSPPALASLTIMGRLQFDDSADRQLQAGWIMLHGGELLAGSASQPFQHRATITLTGTDAGGEAMPGMGTRGLLVMGGKLHLHGRAPQPVWTRLNDHAAAGSASLQLATAVNWQAGDELVLAPTDYYGLGQTERHLLQSVAGNGLGLQLASPLGSARWGRLQYPDPAQPSGLALAPSGWQPPQAPAPTVLDQRAEVGNISRNIVIQSIDDALWQEQGFGAHIMVMDLDSQLVLDGVQLRRVGQAGRTGRYPLHWHMLSYSDGQWLGDASGHVLRNSSIVESANRCVVIHGTNGVTVSNNICYHIRGHALFLEDAVERRNSLTGNLVLHVRDPAPGQVLQQHESSASFPNGASGLWLTNPDNSVTGNAVADIQGTGYWLAFPENPLGLNSSVPLKPRYLALGVFDDNVVHSVNEFGLNLDNPPIDAAGNTAPLAYQPTANNQPPSENNPGAGFTLRRLTTFKNRAAFWNRVYRPSFEEFVAADNPGKSFAGSTAEGFVRRSLVIGTSLNNAHDWQAMATDPAYAGHAPVLPPVAFASYHGGVAMHYNTIINFPFVNSADNTAFGSAPSGAFATDDYYLRPIERSLAQNVGNVLIHSAPGRRSVPLQPQFVFSGTLVDAEGLFGTPGNNWVFDTPFLTWGGQCTPVAPAGLNGQSCNGRYFGAEGFVLDHANDYFTPYMQLQVSRRDPSAPDSEVGQWSVAGVDPLAAPGTLLPNMRHFAMRDGGVFVLRFPAYAGPLSDVNLIVSNMHEAADSVVLAVHYRGSVARVFATTHESYARSAGVSGEPGPSTATFRRYEPVASRAALLNGAGEQFWHDAANELVWIRLRGGISDAWVGDGGPFSDETLYQPFVLRIHDDVAQ